ncbi:hypothetical protein H0H93_009353 [Arthromyces matolae]|nr:hypothetical protein H0H93_009353 [Arthromyces matolae]
MVMATQHAQSLPSFKQAFSNHSLNNSIPPPSNALPPILSRKRSRNDVNEPLVQIKEENDLQPPRLTLDTTSLNVHAPSAQPSPKRRRVTISGVAPDVAAEQTASTPISPVVMGFTITRDNPNAVEKVKSMISVKQKQKALIEQRRGSVAGAPSPSTITVNPPLPEPAKTTPSTRSQRRSPNNNPPRRVVTQPGPPSPTPVIVPSQPQPQPPPVTHSLPPPPISFAKRRAEQLGSNRKKPADILISPREAHSKDQLQPVIQSAPPVPHAGQNAFYGRFQMALPRLPSVLGSGADANVRRVATVVPPTPTRLAMQKTSAVAIGNASASASQPAPSTRRSPPAASVPIASTLVPPTPGLFQHPGYAGDKAAFLAPFELFYDALNDSKQLKSWLGEQLQRSNTMMQTLTQQQEKLNEVVEALVEKQVAPVRQEMIGLQRRVEELEDALRTAGRQQNTDLPAKHKGNKTPLRNGITSSPMPTDSYTFPPGSSNSSSSTNLSLEPSLSSRRRAERPGQSSSPNWGQDRDRDRDAEMGSPPLYDTLPQSTSASTSTAATPAVPRRIETTRSLPLEPPPVPHQSQRLSPRVPYDYPHPQTLSPKPNHHHSNAKTASGERERPNLSRQPSTHNVRESTSGEAKAHVQKSPQAKRIESRRNSIAMAGIDEP